MNTIEINDTAFEVIDRIAKHTGFPVAMIASSMILKGSKVCGVPPVTTASALPPDLNGPVSMTFQAPASVMGSFRGFAADQGACRFGDAFRMNPEIMALTIISRSIKENPEKPLNRRINNLPSLKGILDRCRKLMKTDLVESVSLRIRRDLWENIELACQTHGITPNEWFLCAVGYYAALWGERRPPKSPFERFERGLASDAKKPRKHATSRTAGI